MSIPRSTHPFLVAAIALLVSLQAVPEAGAAIISSGYDWFLSENASFAKAGIDGHPATPGDDPVRLKSFLPSFGAVAGPSPANSLFPSPDPSPVCAPGPCLVLQPPTLDITWRDQHGNVVNETSAHKVQRVVTLGPFPNRNQFDTIVHRLLDVSPPDTVPIEIVYLSLMSVEPVTVTGVPGLFDVYVGLARDPTTGLYVDQIDGRMALTCDNPTNCLKGPASIGRVDETTDNPSDPDFLGLPVTYDVLFIPADQDPVLGNVVARQTSTSIFHGDRRGPGDPFASGRWDVPGPPALLLLGLGSAILLGARFWRKA